MYFERMYANADSLINHLTCLVPAAVCRNRHTCCCDIKPNKNKYLPNQACYISAGVEIRKVCLFSWIERESISYDNEPIYFLKVYNVHPKKAIQLPVNSVFFIAFIEETLKCVEID